MKNILVTFLLVLSFSLKAEVLPDAWVVEESLIDSKDPRPEGMPKIVTFTDKFEVLNMIFSSILNEQASLLSSAFYQPNVDRYHFKYYAVENEDELNAYCPPGERSTYELPDGVKVQKIACSTEKETFIVESLYDRMTLFQQALLLMHERLSIKKNAHGDHNFKALAGLISGLGKIIEIRYKEQKGQFDRLSKDDIKKIRQFYEGHLQLKYQDGNIPVDAYDWSIHENGGGLLTGTSDIDPSAYISVDTIVKQHAVIKNDAKIISSRIEGNATIEDHVQLINFQINGPENIEKINIGSYSILDSVKFAPEEFEESSILNIGKNSKISSSKIKVQYFVLGESANISNGYFCIWNFVSGKNLNLNDSSIDMTYNPEVRGCSYRNYAPEWKKTKFFEKQFMTLGDDQKLQNGSITFESSTDFAPQNTQILYPEISIKNYQTDCFNESIVRLMKSESLSTPCFRQTMYESGSNALLWGPAYDRLPGMKILSKRTVKTKTISKTASWKSDWFGAMVTYFSFSLTFVPMKDQNTKQFMVIDQKIVPVGDYLKRTINFSSEFDVVQKVIAEKLKTTGVFIGDPTASQMEIYLPYH